MIFGSITRMVQSIIKEEMQAVLLSDKPVVVVDGTMGNGNDTLFLSQLVGNDGRVYAFDVQDMAVTNTEKLLETHEATDNVTLIKSGHETMDEYVNEASLIMFNLGYLPRADHKFITKPKTTIMALDKSLTLLTKKKAY